MANTSSTSVPSKHPVSEKQLDTAELIDRLAEEKRLASDSGLPHAYFVDQVKRQLAGNTPDEASGMPGPHGGERKRVANGDAAVFQAWAMPD